MISGTGRSGTNITKAIFAKHSKVATLPFEYRIMIDPDGIIDFYHSFSMAWSPFAADKKIKNLERFLLSKSKLRGFTPFLGKIVKMIDPSGLKITAPEYFGWELEKWIPGYEIHVHQLIDQLKSFEFSGRWPGSNGFSRNNQLYFSDKYHTEELIPILRTFIINTTNSILSKQGREVFVEDNTWNILFADTLLDMLPNARLIHIIRDPRDVVASLMKQNWAPDNLEAATTFYRSIINRWFEIEKKIAPDRFIMVKLEDLSREPEKTIKEMCAFAGLDYEIEMTEIDLSKSNAGRWEKEFSATQIRIIKLELGEIFKKSGYII